MTAHISLFNPIRAEARKFDSVSWAIFYAADDSTISIFMPYPQAEAVAKAFNEAQP